MNRISKKEFKELHGKDKLCLIGAFNESKESMHVILLKNEDRLPTIATKPVSRVDVSSDKITDIACFKVTINNVTLFLVESTADRSKDTSCSWDDIEKSTIVYKLKEVE